jgi:outer membrane lipoprotein-sorting protein
MQTLRLFFLLCLAWPAHAAPLDDRAVLARIDAYLNSYPRLQAHFNQTAPDGSTSEGMLYLERPGRMRWEYEPPSPILIVADGGVITYFDRELSQTSHLSMKDNWLGLLAARDLKVDAMPQLREVVSQNGMIRVQLAQEDGSLAMLFSEVPLTLRQLVAVDATGQATTIALSNIRHADPFPDDFFTLRYRR